MGRASDKTDDLHLTGGLTPLEWWEVGYTDGLLDQPPASAYRPPSAEMADRYAQGRVAGEAERGRRKRLATRAQSAVNHAHNPVTVVAG